MRVSTRNGGRWGFVAAALAWHLACAGNEALPTPRQELSATDLDQARAALVLQLREEALRAAPDVSGSTCVVGADGSAASPRLLQLLSGRGLGIKDASRCVPRGGRLVDAISEAHAVVISVRSMDLMEPGKATAFGTYGLGGLWCGGGAYSLEFKLGKWEAVPEGPRIVC